MILFLPILAWAQVGLININIADVQELDKIPEVGIPTANKIIEYRTINGFFKTIEEIMKVSGIKEVTFLKMKDFITVGTVVGNNLSTASTTTQQTTTTTSTTTSSGSAHTGQAILSDYSEEKKFKVGAGRERLATVRTPIIFEASRNKIGGVENLYRWSFGDGTSALGVRVSHIYQFPGQYNVVLNAAVDRVEEATARTVVTVTEPRLRLAEINPALGYVEVANNSDVEQNLNNWTLRLVDGSFIYYLPLDTIIAPDSTIKIPLNTVGFNNQTSNQELVLVYPGVSEIGVDLVAQVKAEKILALQQQLQALRQQLAQAQNQSRIVSDSNRAPVAPTTVVSAETSGKKENVVILKQKPGWAERIKDVIFN